MYRLTAMGYLLQSDPKKGTQKLIQLLEQEDYCVSAVARRLDVDRVTVSRWIRAHKSVQQAIKDARERQVQRLLKS